MGVEKRSISKRFEFSHWKTPNVYIFLVKFISKGFDFNEKPYFKSLNLVRRRSTDGSRDRRRRQRWRSESTIRHHGFATPLRESAEVRRIARGGRQIRRGNWGRSRRFGREITSRGRGWQHSDRDTS